MALTNFGLDSIGLIPHQLASCNRAGLHTAADILTASVSELNRKLKFAKLEQVHALVLAVARGVAPDTRRLDVILDGEVQNNPAGPSRSELPSVLEVTSTNGHASRKGKERMTNGRILDQLHKDDLSVQWGGGAWLGTGDAELDQALGGGVRLGTVTEITGESAAGKSHLALSLAITSQLPSASTHPGGCMIITSERELTTDRLTQLCQPILAKHYQPGRRKVMTRDVLDNIHSCMVKDIDQLEQILAYKVPQMISSLAPAQTNPSADQESNGTVTGRPNPQLKKPLPIRLIMIDSITALIRGAAADRTYGENNTAGLVARSKHLCSLADKLKAIAVEHNIAIVVVNQVSDVFARPAPLPPSLAQGSQRSSQLSQYYSDYPEPPMLYATQARWFSGQSETLMKEASLGIVWANAINTRIMLSRTGRRRLLNQDDLQPISRKRLKEQMVERQEALAASQQSGHSTSSDPALLVDVDDIRPTLIRRLHVVFSPFAPPGTVDYVITPSGVHALPDSYRLVETDIKRKAKTRKAKQAEMQESDEAEDVDNLPRSPVPLEMPLIPGSDEYEVFDDLGDVPLEYWEGTWDGRVPDYNGVDESAVVAGVEEHLTGSNGAVVSH